MDRTSTRKENLRFTVAIIGGDGKAEILLAVYHSDPWPNKLLF